MNTDRFYNERVSLSFESKLDRKVKLGLYATYLIIFGLLVCLISLSYSLVSLISNAVEISSVSASLFGGGTLVIAIVFVMFYNIIETYNPLKKFQREVQLFIWIHYYLKVNKDFILINRKKYSTKNIKYIVIMKQIKMCFRDIRENLDNLSFFIQDYHQNVDVYDGLIESLNRIRANGSLAEDHLLLHYLLQQVNELFIWQYYKKSIDKTNSSLLHEYRSIYKEKLISLNESIRELLKNYPNKDINSKDSVWIKIKQFEIKVTYLVIGWAIAYIFISGYLDNGFSEPYSLITRTVTPIFFYIISKYKK